METNNEQDSVYAPRGFKSSREENHTDNVINTVVSAMTDVCRGHGEVRSQESLPLRDAMWAEFQQN
jgi:hypothetical protein